MAIIEPGNSFLERSTWLNEYLERIRTGDVPVDECREIHQQVQLWRDIEEDRTSKFAYVKWVRQVELAIEARDKKAAS